jgi:hypothetical protein
MGADAGAGGADRWCLGAIVRTVAATISANTFGLRRRYRCHLHASEGRPTMPRHRRPRRRHSSVQENGQLCQGTVVHAAAAAIARACKRTAGDAKAPLSVPPTLPLHE